MKDKFFEKTLSSTQQDFNRNVPISDFNPLEQTRKSPIVFGNKSQSSVSKPTERYGMSGEVWNATLKVTETLLDIIKAFMVVGGILSASLADVIFGAAGITILFGGSSANFNGTPVWLIGTILSLGASAIQIFLWSAIQKRGITLSHLLHWKKIPGDMRAFLTMAGVIWFLDTLIDMSPIALLVQNSQYEAIETLYIAMIVAVSIIVFILCGFSEIMTSNMRGILTGATTQAQTSRQPVYNTKRAETSFPSSIPKKK